MSIMSCVNFKVTLNASWTFQYLWDWHLWVFFHFLYFLMFSVRSIFILFFSLSWSFFDFIDVMTKLFIFFWFYPFSLLLSCFQFHLFSFLNFIISFPYLGSSENINYWSENIPHLDIKTIIFIAVIFNAITKS